MPAQRRLGKFTAPNVRRALARKRLFTALDAARERPIVWIGSPAGSGKTTLASSYIASRRFPVLWFRVDPDDSDPASFFHHLAEAARSASSGRRAALPRFTPELLPGIQAFARNFARRMFEQTAARTILVLDNYQELSPESAVHELIPRIVEEAPEDFRLMVLSREAPPREFARLAGHEQLARLGWEELRFNAREARAFMSSRSSSYEPKRVQELLDRSQGWIAGLILLGEGAMQPLDAPANPEQEGTFDYFATEVLRDTATPLREFLLKSAFAPELTAAIAGALTGNPHAGQFLADLVDRNYFTVRHQERYAVYQYHPLFHEFLRRTAEHEYGAKGCATLRALAARALEEAGEMERAAESYAALRDWDSLTRVLHSIALAVLSEGRYRTVFGWLKSVPDSVLEARPWMRFWRGSAMLVFEPPQGFGELKKSYEQFRSVGDVVGRCVAWSSVCDAMVFLNLLESLPGWVEERRSFTLPRDAPSLVRVRYITALYSALVFVCQDDPEIERWEAEALDVIDSNAPPAIRVQLGGIALNRATWSGAGCELGDRIVVRLASAAASPHAPPFAAFFWWAHASQHHYLHSAQADDRDCIACLEKARALAREHNMYILGYMLPAAELELALSHRDMKAAAEAVKALDDLNQPFPANTRSFIRFMKAWHCRETGDTAGMLALAEEAVRIAFSVPFPTGHAYSMALLGLAKAQSGAVREALSHLTASRRVAQRYRNFGAEYVSLVFSTLLALDRGRPSRALPFLRRALTIGVRQRFFRVPGLIRSDFERLCAFALEHGVETEYVRLLIRVRRLSPPSGSRPQNWPWPIAVSCLGNFEIKRDDAPIRFGRKAPKKPLELLKALIALGGSASETRLIAMLWPREDSAAGRRALATTLHRLRAIVGEKTLLTNHQHVTLDRDSMWVDSWSFDVLLDRAAQADSAQREKLLERAVALYRGDLLASEDQTWEVSARYRLHERFAGAVTELAHLRAFREDWRGALAWYQRGLEQDELIEEFHRGVMSAYAALGCRGEAIAAYRRCQRSLSKMLGVVPSQATEAQYRTLLDAPGSRESSNL